MPALRPLLVGGRAGAHALPGSPRRPATRVPELLALSSACSLLASSLVLHLPIPAAVQVGAVAVEEEGSSPTELPRQEAQG